MTQTTSNSTIVEEHAFGACPERSRMDAKKAAPKAKRLIYRHSIANEPQNLSSSLTA